MATKLAGCVLLDNKGRIGLLHRNKASLTQWELPGGKVEPSETDEAAAIRELKEELDVAVSILGRLGETSFSHQQTTIDYVWFQALVISGMPKVNEPQTFDDFRYFSIKELGSLDLSANMQKLFPLLKNGVVVLKPKVL